MQWITDFSRSFDLNKDKPNPHSNCRITSWSGSERLCLKADCPKLQGEVGCWFWPSKMNVLPKSKCKTCPSMNFFGFQFIIGNSSVTATKKFQNILSSSVIAGGIYGEHLSQNRRIDRSVHVLYNFECLYSYILQSRSKLLTWKNRPTEQIKWDHRSIIERFSSRKCKRPQF